MENNEIMNYDEIEVMDDAIVAEEKSGVGTGVAMLIGAGLALAVGAGVKLGKKMYANFKAKREIHKPDKEVIVDEEDLVAVATK